MTEPTCAAPPLSLRRGLLYAAGDIGPSLTSLCLSFYWLYFLIDVAGLPVLHAGLIHGSGYVVSAAANLWAGSLLDRRLPSPAARARLIARAGLALGLCFALLWVVPGGTGSDTGMLWYLALSWLFHLVFALVYLAYLSLTPLLAASAQERVDLNSYRFGGTMLVTLIVLGLHTASDGIWDMRQRLLVLGAAVGLLAALGCAVCGMGLRSTLVLQRFDSGAQSAGWGALARSAVLWRAVGANLAVWFMVQSASVLTIFLCKSAAVAEAPVLLLMQFCIIAAAVATSLASRRWTPQTVMAAAAAVWCVGALCWWQAAAPHLAAALLGLGLGAATVISWAEVPAALERYASISGQRSDARVYAALTVLRDLVSAMVPMLATASLAGQAPGSAQAGLTAATALLAAAICAALVLAAVIRLLRDDGTAAAPK